ncbi:pyruvate:ferredoxin (flavodoxin) oxidoreductase, partial [Vibrio anguillarum]|nr:pyruvate:ferredoxin (flavodoxin) oxidoreductase [Vibrio anguillarum]
PDVVQTCMDEFAQLTGRAYHLVEYCGHPQATRLIIALGSVSETLNQYVQSKPDESVGVVTVHLYRPFPTQALLNALPESVQQISVLDRTKEPGSSGEPLYLDVLDAIYQSGRPIELFRGRYGLSGKAFFPEDAQHIFAMMRNEHGRKREFVVGIDDDVTHLSLPVTSQPEREEALQTVLMYGYGGDGSISAGKNVLKALGKQNHWYVNAQFEYDSKKSRNLTTTHLRLSEQPIQTPYPIRQARLISLSQLGLLKDIDIM